MATQLKLKRSSEAGKIPAALLPGELAINLTDKKLFSADADGNVFEVSSGGNSGPSVTSIIAGTNITIDPVGGVGAVTINATASSDVDELSDLSDVTFTDLKSGEILSFNGSSWINASSPPADISSSSINQLNDVKDDMAATDGQVLTWDSGEWVADDLPAADAPSLQAVCDEGSTTTTTISAAGFRIDLLPDLPSVYSSPPPAPEPTPRPTPIRDRLRAGKA